jgi:hypothetical protein
VCIHTTHLLPSPSFHSHSSLFIPILPSLVLVWSNTPSNLCASLSVSLSSSNSIECEYSTSRACRLLWTAVCWCWWLNACSRKQSFDQTGSLQGAGGSRRCTSVSSCVCVCLYVCVSMCMRACLCVRACVFRSVGFSPREVKPQVYKCYRLVPNSPLFPI